jgi:YebC/PmpR family DNA-binding regulatory protein
MAGHSKWSKIKRKKAVTDASRGKIFTKLLKEIQIAAKIGGGALDGNPRLKTAVVAAKSQSVPNDNIDRAIKKGTGDLEGVDYEEITYEGYTPGGAALLISALTDNKTRTVAEVRHALSKFGGSLGSSNSVAFMFKQKSVFSISQKDISEDQLYETLIDAGIEDITGDGDNWEIFAEVQSYNAIQEALEKMGKGFEGELRLVPDNTVKVEGDDAQKLVNLLEFLDDLDDIQSVTGNFELDENVLA